MIAAEIILLVLGFVALVFASIHDLKTREVPDWVSFSLVVSAFSVRIFHSLIFNDFWFLLYGVLGFGLMFAVGMLMYYTKQWGGGDAKLVMGLGVVFVSPYLGFDNLVFSLLVNMLVVGATYGIFWSVYLAIKNYKVFIKGFRKALIRRRRIRRVALIFGLLTIISLFFIKVGYIRFLLSVFALFLIAYSYLVVFVKAVEDSCMYKWIPVNKLTEGDWVAKPVYVNKKIVCGPKDLGLEMKQIKALKKAKVKKVYVKEGIPFVPSFLIAAILTLLFGNLILLF